MASKAAEKKTGLIPLEAAEEMLDTLDKALDRLKTMYEQFFLGVQKQAPGMLHSEVERRIRDLMQVQLRNTVHRYKFVTLQQKFGSYNTYWRRTLKQIESGKYIRQLAKVGREAVKNGTEIPEEILSAMPKRMREQVLRDREAALSMMRRRGQMSEEELLDLGLPSYDEAPVELSEDAFAEEMARIEAETAARKVKQVRGPHRVDENDGEMDLDSFFKEVEAAPEPPPPEPRAMKKITAPPPIASSQQQSPRQTAPMGRVQVDPPPDLQPGEGEPPSGGMRLKKGQSKWPVAATQTGVPPGPSTPAAPTMTPLPPKSPLAQQAGPGVPVLPPKSPLAQTQGIPKPPGAARPSQPVIPTIPKPGERPSQAIPTIPNPAERPSQPMPAQNERPSQPMASQRPSQPMPAQRPSQPMAAQPPPPSAGLNPDTSRPHRPSQPQIPREQVVKTPPPQRQHARASTDVDPPARPERPPPGMTDADVNALYAKYVKAKEMVGENAGPGAYGKLLKTINSQAPKIMEQYKAKGVEFQIVVKDNQVIIRAKPKG